MYGQTMWMIDRFKAQVASLLVAFLAGFLFFESATPAEAHSRAQICRGLTNQLSSLGSRASGGNSAKYRQFDTAIRKQEGQVNKAKRALRRQGCVGIFKNTKSQCRAINKSLKQMRANLSKLKRQRARHAPKRSNDSSKRRKILAAMRRHRCNSTGAVETRQATKPKKSKRRTILEQVFGVGAYDEKGNRKKSASVQGDAQIASRFGTFRTLCVRKSDGYYFPISFSTVKERFEGDEQVCQAMCPSSEVALYHHRMPNEDSEDMVSFATNTPYRDESFAFAYRKSHNSENRCRFSTAGLTQIAGTSFVEEENSEEKTNKTIRIGLPVFRKDPTLSPDAFDTSVEGLNLDGIKTYIAAVEEKKDAPQEQLLAENRKVRIVGPAFFPVQ